MVETERDPVMPESEIVFEGRTMRVRMPRPEQILVWRRIMHRLDADNVKDWNGKEVIQALERVRAIIDSVLIDKEDIDWLDDEMLAGRIGMVKCSDVLLEATKAFQNRAERRQTDKKAPARRKAPAKTALKNPIPPAKKAPAKKATPRKRASS